MYKTLTTVVSLIFFLHLMACTWIAIGLMENTTGELQTTYWIERTSFVTNAKWRVYWTSWYFITTTITTVGYGDFFAVTNLEKVFNIFLLFTGILCFTVIQQRTKSSFKEQTMKAVLAKAHDDAIEFLFLIDDPLPEAIHDVFYDSLANLKVREAEKSTLIAFSQNKFYSLLPPNL